ncbi:hypothetical protein [Fusobacterium animalis]|uniref:hypothetical protein n=1 Tax=Fusobacterium animalis TaxID=76859 RepID=UPI000761DB55|nr:hypothetical protein [Fusobacterium animalis]QYR67099.1 hypothetical protein JY401_07945 [Fusobacterium animalis]
MVDSRLQIAENQEDIAKAFEEVSEDLGYKVKVIYTDPSNSPQLIGVDKDGNTYIKDGTAYVDKDTGIGYILINTKSPANRTKAGVIGTIAEEQSHVIGKIEGRQKIVPDGSEKGLESLGRPTNNYFKNQYSKNDKAIGLKSDGRDYSNVDFGEHVGDGEGFAVFKASLYRAVSSYPIIYKKDDIEMDPIGMTKEYKKLENEIEKILVDEKNNISSEKVHEELRKMATIGGTGHNYSSYEGIYVIDDPNLRKKFIDKDNNLNLALFDPKGWNEIKKSESYKNAVNNLKQKAIKYYEENKLKSKEEIEKKRSVSETVKFADLSDTDKSEIEYALGNSTIVGSIVMRRGKPYLKYNLSDKFEDITGLNKGPLEIEWGQPYDMIGPTKLVPLYDKK